MMEYYKAEGNNVIINDDHVCFHNTQSDATKLAKKKDNNVDFTFDALCCRGALKHSLTTTTSRRGEL